MSPPQRQERLFPSVVEKCRKNLTPTLAYAKYFSYLCINKDNGYDSE